MKLLLLSAEFFPTGGFSLLLREAGGAVEGERRRPVAGRVTRELPRPRPAPPGGAQEEDKAPPAATKCRCRERLHGGQRRGGWRWCCRLRGGRHEWIPAPWLRGLQGFGAPMLER